MGLGKSAKSEVGTSSNPSVGGAIDSLWLTGDVVGLLAAVDEVASGAEQEETRSASGVNTPARSHGPNFLIAKSKEVLLHR